MKKILKNASYLYIIQILNQLFPLLLFPIIIREIGVNDFGIFQFAISFFAFLFIFLDYGHNLNASREIAILKNNKKDISKYFCVIMSSRIFLYFFCLIITNIIIYLTGGLSEYKDILNIFWIYLLGTVLFPLWFFQGIEKMVLPLISQFIFKIIILILIMWLVEPLTGLISVSWIYSLVTLIQSFVVILVIFKYFGITAIVPSYKETYDSLVEGKAYFFAQGATALFSSINPLILGVFSTPSMVAVYTLADKVVRSAVLLVGVVNKVIYPISARIFNKSVLEGVIFIKKVMKIGSLIMISVCILLVIIAPLISQYFLGDMSKDLTLFIRILSVLPFSIFINNLFGNQILLNINEVKKFSLLIYTTVLVSIISMVILIPLFGGLGVAVSSLISEVYIAVAATIVSIKALKESGVNYFEV